MRRPVLVVGILLLISCGSKDLTRENAKPLLEQALSEGELVKPIRKGQFYNCGFASRRDVRLMELMHEMGLVTPKECQVKSSNSSYELTPQGKEAGFTFREFRMAGDTGDGRWAPTISVGAPCYHPSLADVTGVTSASPTEAIVEFEIDWEPTPGFQSYPSVFEAILGHCDNTGPTEMRALFRLYDDGWRIIEVGNT